MLSTRELSGAGHRRLLFRIDETSLKGLEILLAIGRMNLF